MSTEALGPHKFAWWAVYGRCPCLSSNVMDYLNGPIVNIILP